MVSTLLATIQPDFLSENVFIDETEIPGMCRLPGRRKKNPGWFVAFGMGLHMPTTRYKNMKMIFVRLHARRNVF